MSSTQITNLDLSEPQEVLDTEVKSKESNDTSTLNSEDQEVQNNLIEEKQKDKDLESETIVEERKQFEEVVEEQQKDTDNDSARKELNQGEQDKEKSAVTDVNTNETEQISEENKDQSEWSAVWDDNAQAYYYWNMVTNETTWVNPNNNNLTAQPVNSEYSEYYYYSQYGYYPEAYYYGYDNSTLTSSDMTTAATTTEPPTNPLDSLLDKIDKEVKSKLDKNSSKTKSSSTSDSQYNDQQYQQEQEQEQEEQEQEQEQEQQERQEQTSLISSSTDLDPYYDQYQMATNDSDYQSFLAEHGDNSEYKLTARFNAKTGKFQRDPTLNPEKFSADSKAIRQMSYFFDYDQFAETRGSAASNKRLSSEASLGDSIRSPKKLNKKDIEMFKQKKKEKKDMKKKSWLLSEND